MPSVLKPAAVVRLGRACTPTLRYVMETEVHVYAFSISANVLLSLFPFLLVILWFCRDVLGWQAAVDAIIYGVRDTFPAYLGDFLSRNADVVSRSAGIEWLSMLLLLFTANGIFEPLEVALNRAWGITRNRSFIRNQIVSMGLIFACGSLVLLSVMLTALNREVALDFNLVHAANALARLAFFKAAALPLSILALFLVYWLLPNAKIPARELIAPAIVIGLALEALKYVSLVLSPWIEAKLRREYGPFLNSATLILWSFCASMIVLAGAEWTARNRRQAKPDRPGASILGLSTPDEVA